MWINFYKVTDEARNDYKTLCPKSLEKTINQSLVKTDDYIITQLNRKIRKCCNLGKVIDNKNGVEVRQYFDLLFVIKNYKIIFIYRDESLPKHYVSKKYKDKYDWLEEKITLAKADREMALMV